jgi:hypothetical protein
MTIVTTSTYEPSERVTVDGKGIVSLLKDVGADIIEFGKLKHLPVEQILLLIEQGKFETPSHYFQGKGTLLKRLDLSAAKAIVDTYKRNSEGGCQSCVYRKPVSDEGGEYCDIYEILKNQDVRNMGKSPCLNQYWEKGCKNKLAPLLPLTEVLAKIKE